MTPGSPERIRFLPLELDRDLEHLFQWLGDEDIHRWYDEGEHTRENYREQFGPEEGMHRHIIQIDGQSAGYIQAYWLHGEEEYAEQLGLPHDAVSLDVFLGERSFYGQGWGTAALKEYLRLQVFGAMDADYACINPDPANARAIRSYEKAGFRGERVVEIKADRPGDAGPERIMVLARTAFLAGEPGYGADS